jgi:hypothetical protein
VERYNAIDHSATVNPVKTNTISMTVSDSKHHSFYLKLKMNIFHKFEPDVKVKKYLALAKKHNETSSIFEWLNCFIDSDNTTTGQTQSLPEIWILAILTTKEFYLRYLTTAWRVQMISVLFFAFKFFRFSYTVTHSINNVLSFLKFREKISHTQCYNLPDCC